MPLGALCAAEFEGVRFFCKQKSTAQFDGALVNCTLKGLFLAAFLDEDVGCAEADEQQGSRAYRR